jgi:PAS domain S-box-containing protein
VGDRVCFSWREVTERFSNEQVFAMSRNRYRLLAENSSDVVVLVAPDGAIEWVSPSVRDMFGWEPEEIVGRQSSDFVFADDLRRRMAVHSRPAALRPSTDEVRCRCAGGSYLWVSARMREIRDRDGRLANVVVSIRDVQKQVQAARRSSPPKSATGSWSRTSPTWFTREWTAASHGSRHRSSGCSDGNRPS